MSIKELTEKLNSLTAANRKLIDQADAEQGGKLSSDQEVEYEARDKEIEETLSQIDGIKKQNDRRDRMKQLSELQDKPVGRQASAGLAGKLASAAGISEMNIAGKTYQLQAGTVDHLRSQPDYQARFLKHIQTGKDTGLSDWQSLGLTVGNQAKGGYLVPMTFLDKLIRFLNKRVFMRELATVISGVSSSGLGVPTHEADPADADWTTEILSNDQSEDDTMTFGKREMVPQDLMKAIYVSRRLIDGNGSLIDIESFIAERMGYKFAVTEEKAGMTGTGVLGWHGIFVASANGITTSQDVVASAATSFTGDDIIEWTDDLDEAYKANATIVAHKSFIKRCRKLKTSGSGEYIWGNPFADRPATINGIPFRISEYAPSTYTASQYIAVVGDFKAGYWIADGFDMTVERDDSIRRLKKQAVLVGEKSSDGAPVVAEAFRRLQLAAS